MLLRAPVSALRANQISRRQAHIAVVMRHFPRYVAKPSIDEYVRELAPDGDLFAEFKARERAIQSHNQAFADVAYEERFALGEAGDLALARLAELARGRDVYLICQCGFEQRCHTDLLLLMARARHDVLIGQRPFSYPVFEARLSP